MYRDQLGEFVCGYWGLKGQVPSCFSNPACHFSCQKGSFSLSLFFYSNFISSTLTAFLMEYLVQSLGS